MVGCSWFFFFFKQKTAYEMRISDWGSDVCSSDLRTDVVARGGDEDVHHLGRADAVDDGEAGRVLPGMPGGGGEMLAGRDAGVEAGDVAAGELAQYRPVGRGRRGGGGDFLAVDRIHERARARFMGHIGTTRGGEGGGAYR